MSRQSFDAPYHNFGHSLKSDHSPILVELKSIKSYVHRSVYILLKIVANVAYLPQKQPYIANSENLRAALVYSFIEPKDCSFNEFVLNEEQKDYIGR